MNVKDYIFGSEIEIETVYPPIEDEKKMPKISLKMAIYKKGEPMPTHTDIVNIVDDNLLYQSKDDKFIIYRNQPYFCNNKDIENYLYLYFKVFPDKHIFIYYYVDKYTPKMEYYL